MPIGDDETESVNMGNTGTRTILARVAVRPGHGESAAWSGAVVHGMAWRGSDGGGAAPTLSRAGPAPAYWYG